MIFEKIVEVIMAVPMFLLGLLPTLDFDIPSDVVSAVGNVFYGVNYFIPINAVLPILVISFGVVGFRIIYATILRIKSFLPWG